MRADHCDRLLVTNPNVWLRVTHQPDQNRPTLTVPRWTRGDGPACISTWVANVVDDGAEQTRKHLRDTLSSQADAE
eukprot:387241-Pyramimonas_sp.AAC.3